MTSWELESLRKSKDILSEIRRTQMKQPLTITDCSRRQMHNWSMASATVHHTTRPRDINTINCLFTFHRSASPCQRNQHVSCRQAKNVGEKFHSLSYLTKVTQNHVHFMANDNNAVAFISAINPSATQEQTQHLRLSVNYHTMLMLLSLCPYIDVHVTIESEKCEASHPSCPYAVTRGNFPVIKIFKRH